MNFFEIKTDKGVLKYRMPNILEAYDLLDASGINSGNYNMLKLKRNIIESMGPLINVESIEGYESYNDLLLDTENMMAPLSAIADEVIEKTFDVFKKKT
jgi:hypothetical protein